MPLSRDNLKRIAETAAMGDTDAAAFVMNVAAMARLADDLADGDAQDRPRSMADLLYRALVHHATNPFFRAHSRELCAVMTNALVLWDMSERWRESDNRKTRMFAFVVRESVEQVAYTVAAIKGGIGHARDVADDIMRLSHETSEETFEDWDRET